MIATSGKVIIVTGGAGFVGSNLVRKLNLHGHHQVVIIDQYEEKRFPNLQGLSFIDYISYHKGLTAIEQELHKYQISAVLHIGANADVLVSDAELMMHANYDHSRFYLQYCQQREIPFIYASSSAVYGNSNRCLVNNLFEYPHNIYAWSKWMFDQHVQHNISRFNSKVVGLRFFNIFGMGEYHKGKNASLPHRFFKFVQETGTIDLFDEDIRRDYVWVDDVTQVILDVLDDSSIANGIYNLGSANAISHQELAEMVIEVFADSGLKSPEEMRIIKIPLPPALAKTFQFYTQAEQLPDFVKKYTTDNIGKIKNYLRQMIAHEYKGQVPVYSSKTNS